MMRLKTCSLLLLFTIVAVSISACGALGTTPTPLPQGVHPVEPPVQLKDFALTDTSNQTISLADWKGKIALVTFGYTHCPDVCPINLAIFKQIKQTINSPDNVNFIFISVDGDRDTPAVLRKHLNNFDPSFIGLTGAEAAVRPMASQFGVEYTLNKATPTQQDYTVTHSASSFLVDAQGRLRRIFDYQTNAKVVATEISLLLQEKAQ